MTLRPYDNSTFEERKKARDKIMHRHLDDDDYYGNPDNIGSRMEPEDRSNHGVGVRNAMRKLAQSHDPYYTSSKKNIGGKE